MALLSSTPIWVWAILIFLISFGVRQLKSRDVHRIQLVTAPTICVSFMLISALRAANPFFGVLWLSAGDIIGVTLSWLKFRHAPLLSKKAASSNPKWRYQRGSIIPLITYLYIFGTRYFATILPHLPIHKNLPNNASSILLGATGIGMGVLLSIILSRKDLSIQYNHTKGTASLRT